MDEEVVVLKADSAKIVQVILTQVKRPAELQT